MRKSFIFTLAAFLFIGIAATARTLSTVAKPEKRTITISKPNLEQIKNETLDPKSKFYFPKLFAKYSKNDTVMTPEEFRYLYLGYMFQEDYDPYRTSPYDEKLAPLRTKSQHTRQEVDTLIKYAELSLYNNPFDLRSMSFLVHALNEKQKTHRAKFWEFKLENLLAAIKSTGTGENVDNAWMVIYPAHEYDIAQLLGYNAVDVDFETYPGYDVLKVEPEEGAKIRKPVSEMYFNVIIPTDQFEAKHPEDLE